MNLGKASQKLGFEAGDMAASQSEAGGSADSPPTPMYDHRPHLPPDIDECKTAHGPSPISTLASEKTSGATRTMRTNTEATIGSRHGLARQVCNRQSLVARCKLALTLPGLGLHLAAITCWGLLGCEDDRTIQLAITTGYEEGALSVEPAVDLVRVRATFPAEGAGFVEMSGHRGESFELGNVPDNAPVVFDLFGTAADGSVTARGRSAGFVIGSVEQGPIPLFIQRLGSFARPPSGLAEVHLAAKATSFAERYVLTTGGRSVDGSDPRSAEFYDLVTWSGQQSVPLPRIAESLVVRDTRVLLIDRSGATWVDLANGTEAEAIFPPGFSAEDVAGGATIEAEGSVSFVVGASRPEAPTDVILEVNPLGAFTVRKLARRASDATAAYIPNVGIVVAEGGVDDAIQVLALDGTASILPIPRMARAGALAPLEGARILWFGSTDSEAVCSLDLSCSGGCACEPLGSTPLAPFSQGRAFRTGTATLVVGQANETVAYRVDLLGQVEPLPLREPRMHAAVTPAPNGTLAILGGQSPIDNSPIRTIEFFFPD